MWSERSLYTETYAVEGAILIGVDGYYITNYWEMWEKGDFIRRFWWKSINCKKIEQKMQRLRLISRKFVERSNRVGF